MCLPGGLRSWHGKGGYDDQRRIEYQALWKNVRGTGTVPGLAAFPAAGWDSEPRLRVHGAGGHSDVVRVQRFGGQPGQGAAEIRQAPEADFWAVGR